MTSEAIDASPPTWRRMTGRDLISVARVAAQVHPDHPESSDVFAERLRLYPTGCFVLATEVELSGYVISHPWRFREPPALDTLIGALPDAPSTYYVHDMALLPSVRGSGHAIVVLEWLVARAQGDGLTNISLVAVNSSGRFWERHGFCVVSDEALRAKLASYGANARYMARTL